MSTQAPLTATPKLSTADLEQLYHAKLRITRVVEFGTSMQSVLTGEAAPPPCGARFDVHVEGPISGTRLNGQLTAVDYVQLRADGRMELHIHGVVTSAEGATIAAYIDGTGRVEAGGKAVHLHEDVSLHCSDPRYQWVNTLSAWGRGIVDLERMEVTVDTYVA